MRSVMSSEEYNNSFCRDLTEDFMIKYGFNRATAAAIVKHAVDEQAWPDDIACYADRLAQFVHTILEYN